MISILYNNSLVTDESGVLLAGQGSGFYPHPRKNQGRDRDSVRKHEAEICGSPSSFHYTVVPCAMKSPASPTGVPKYSTIHDRHIRSSNVEHLVAYPRVQTNVLRHNASLCTSARIGWCWRRELIRKVASCSFTDQICVVRRRTDANRSCGAAEEIAQRMCHLLESICRARITLFRADLPE